MDNENRLAEEIQGFYDYARRERNVKDVSLRHYAHVLRPALKQAFKAGIIPDNPYEFVLPIGKEKPPVQYYDKKELEVLFEKLEGHQFELAYKMLASYGFRRSELLGLRWE